MSFQLLILDLCKLSLTKLIIVLNFKLLVFIKEFKCVLFIISFIGSR